MKTAVSISIADQVEAQIDRSQWRTFKFSDLAENINEKISPKSSDLKHYIGLEHLDSGSLKIRRFGNPKTIKGDKLKIYKGDLIFAKRNAYLKRVSVAEFDAIASAHSLVLRARPETVLPEFLPFFLLSEAFWERAIAISVGSLSPTINWKALAKQEFLLPPKDQQAKLAELLWAADAVLESLMEVHCHFLSLLGAVRRGLNHGDLSTFTGEELTSLVSKGSSPKWQGFDYTDDGMLFVTSENVLDDEIDLKNGKFLPLEFNEKLKRSQLRKGDVLINLVGASIGRLAVFDVDVEVANVNQAVGVFRCDTSKVLPEYIVQYLLELGNNQRLVNNQSESARPNLSLTNLREFRFHIPDIPEQRKRLHRISAMKCTSTEAKRKAESTTVLLKSLINQIF